MDASTVATVTVALFGAGGVVALVRIAVGSETRRANDWREIARTASEASDRQGEHVKELVIAVNQLAAAQRDGLAILHAIQAERAELIRDAVIVPIPPPRAVGGVE